MRPTPSAHVARLRDPAVQHQVAKCEALLRDHHARIAVSAIHAELEASPDAVLAEIGRRIAAQGV